MKLSPYKMYHVTKNFVTINNPNGSPMLMDKARINKLKDLKVQLETRTGVIVISSGDDEMAYINYINLLSELSAPIIAQGIDNKFTELLDSGYLPLYCLPSIFNNGEADIFYNCIVDSGLDYVRRPALKVTGERLDSLPEDIWVSRLDLAEKFGVKPEQQKATDMLMKILSL